MKLEPEDRKKLNTSFTKGLSLCDKPAPLKLSEWADKNFYLSSESSAVEGRWVTYPNQKGIMNTISNDDVRIVTLFKSARVGYTKIITAAIGYFAEHKNRSQVVWQPTDTDAADFTGDEINPMIRDVPLVRKKLKGDIEKKGSGNTTHKKVFLGSILHINGGTSGRNYRRMTKDVGYYDELEGFDDDIDGEGSATSLGDMRMASSSFSKSVRGSTPRTKGSSQIQSSLDDADVVFRRHVPCPECDQLQYLKWSGMTWTDHDSKTTKYACEHCGSLIDYSRFPDMDKAGRWMSADGTYLDDDDNFRDIDDELIEPPLHVGFVIWAAYSYITSWATLVAEFLKANQASKQGDKTKLKTFTNTRLGELWEEESETLEGSNLLSRCESYGPDIPEGVLVLTAGIDVQDDRLEIEVMGTGHDYQTWSIEYNVIVGDTSVDPTVSDSIWTQLDDYLKTTFTHESGAKMRIAATCIDSGHRTQHVYKFCMARMGRRIFAIKGMDGQGKPIAGDWSQSKKYKAKFIPVGTDTAKGLIYSRLKVEEVGPGYCHFPDYDETYFNGLASEKCIIKFIRGKRSRAWVLKSSGIRNEPLDCRVYNLAALELLSPNMKALEDRLQPREEIKIKQEDPMQQKIAQRKPLKRRSRGYVNSWR